jgi:hypothetical protein
MSEVGYEGVDWIHLNLWFLEKMMNSWWSDCSLLMVDFIAQN